MTTGGRSGRLPGRKLKPDELAFAKVSFSLNSGMQLHFQAPDSADGSVSLQGAIWSSGTPLGASGATAFWCEEGTQKLSLNTVAAQDYWGK